MTPADIKALRASLGWPQSRLARECGVSIRTVKYWESGQRNPSGSALIILARLRLLATYANYGYGDPNTV